MGPSRSAFTHLVLGVELRGTDAGGGCRQALKVLADGGVQIIAMRCAGYDRVDVPAAAKLGLKVVRVPIYSPASVAEHAVGMMFALNR
jgi:D-lactate dehydrogenase